LKRTSDPEGRSRILRKQDRPVLIVNVIYIAIFTAIALQRANYEFVLYAGVVILVAALILGKQHRVQFDQTILWGLTAWGLMHMAGGNIRVGDGILYEVQLIPKVLRYDQWVHFFGFGTATLVCYHLLRPYLRVEGRFTWALSTLVVFMGMGVGALNEIIEFIAVLVMPETGVGGYENTLWDLVFNTLGASAAVVYLAVREPRVPKSTNLSESSGS